MQRTLAENLVSTIQCAHPAEQAYFDLHRYRYVDTLLYIDPQWYKHKVIADLGLLPAHLSLALKRGGAKMVTGVDYDPNRFEGQARLEALGLIVKQADIEQECLPFGNATVDFCLFTEVIEHLENGTKHCLEELHRILKDDSHALITTPNVRNLANRIRRFLRQPLYTAHEGPTRKQLHHHEYSMKELRHLLEENGFQVERYGYIAGSEKAILHGTFPTKIPRPLASMYALFPLAIPRLRSYLAVVVTKR